MSHERTRNNSSRTRQAGTLVDLLTVIGNEITSETLAKLKFQLRGHVDKEVLDYSESGSELLLILHKRGLVTSRRLAFLRKLLTETRCPRLLSYLDYYKDKNSTRTWADEGFIEASSRRSGKERRLHELIERIENEIKFHEDNGESLKRDLEEVEQEIETSKEKITSYEDCILKIKSHLKKEHLNSQSVEKKLDDVKYLIRKLYREEESIQEKLQRAKPKKFVQDELIAKHAEIKGNQLVEGALLKKYETISTNMRLSYTDFRHQTNEMMEVEKKMQDDTFRLRKLKKELSKNAISSNQLKETLIDVKQELEELKHTAPYTPQLCISRISRETSNSPKVSTVTTAPVQFKILDYNELIERTEPLVIGRKGRKSNPPNFMFPCSITVDPDDHIYVADSKNHRVHVLHMNGSPARKPMEFGTFQPSSVAVSNNGKVFVSDSHVVRVCSFSGQPVCTILPVFGKADLRPKITSLAITKDGAILIVDTANKRIQKFREDGTFLCFIGGSRVFQSPFGIAVAKNGDIIVSESETHQIKIFEGENGPLKKQFGTRGIGKDKFFYPRGIALDNDNNIIVADSGNHQIQILSTRDGEVASFGSLGSTPGFFDTPYDVALTNDGKKVVVVETRNHRLQVFTRAVPDNCLIDNSLANTVVDGQDGCFEVDRDDKLTLDEIRSDKEEENDDGVKLEEQKMKQYLSLDIDFNFR